MEHTAPISPTRPGSAWTNNSLFADSAISMRTNTPGPIGKSAESPTLSDTPSPSEIATRLNGFVSEIWASEQDGTIRSRKRRRLEKAIRDIEVALEEDSSEEDDSEESTPQRATLPAPISEQDLEAIRISLASTVESMRMRQQEQKHLHRLTVEKLEAVAQRCLQQENRLRDFAEDMMMLKQENRLLRQENDRIHADLSRAHTESAKKEVAVDAMSSAVAGLEGWINGSPTPARTMRKLVTRGRGRFRGRYYVEEPVGASPKNGLDGTSDAKALHEGVTAWLRGFRDVEEELRVSKSSQPPRLNAKKNAPVYTGEDEWGDFEYAPAT
ncbi:hypothetical protein LTS15_007424 [Exophiala xenobiotica]|nr:hypothetical protein LTS15_007424 [Exophiala xenobiotica]